MQGDCTGTAASIIRSQQHLCLLRLQTYARGRVALVGDAAHLATPFLGQGCSQAIEDGLELGREAVAGGLRGEGAQPSGDAAAAK